MKQMKYTVSKATNDKVEADMKVIVEELRKRIPGALSIILTGGFSRGEGPVKKIGKKGKEKFYLYNDYDVQVIAKEKLSKEEVDDIASEISQKLGYKGIKDVFYPFRKEGQTLEDNFYVDLKCDTPEDLKGLLPRIRNYELRNHSMILWGEDLRGLIPNYKMREIPRSEGAKLLLDRMSQMIEYYSTEGKYDKEVLTYFIQQAYTACCTSLLLLSGKYKIGYKTSMEILKESYVRDFPELKAVAPDLHKKIEQFVNWKTNPQKLPNEDVEAEWFLARKNILEVGKYFFGKFLGKKITGIGDLSRAILGMRRAFYLPYLKGMTKNKSGIDFGDLNILLLPFVSFALKYKYYKRLKILGVERPSVLFGKSPDLVIFSSLCYLIGSITETGVDERLLGKGQALLREVYPSKGHDWERASLDYANAYIAFFMQKL